jgi:xanthine dehydrogenase accessory factor
MKLWQHLLQKLQENHRVYLLTVTENIGSSPGRKGFKMMVADDGFIFGSIGGGVMEHDLVEEIKHLLLTKELPIFLKKQIHKGRIKDGSGMICSGEQTVVFHPLNAYHIPTIKNVLNCLQQNKTGTLSLSPTSFAFSDENITHQFKYQIESATDWTYKEQLGFKNTLYIVGGGHVSLAVSDLFASLGFYVVVLDDREHLNTFEINKSAHQKSVVDYHDIANYIVEGNSSYVAIMTNTYTADKLVLSSILKKEYRYIGVLGSTAKLQTMWDVLQKEGISLNELAKVHAPIGMSIKSQTPEEIAVSIAAEIIQHKNKNS